MANETGNSCSGPKRRRSSASMDPEPSFPVPISSSLDPTIETVLRKAVRQRLDAEKAYTNLQARIKLLETHLSQGTIPSGLRIKKIQAKGPNVDTLQAAFDDIVRKAEFKLLEATIANLHSEIKEHQEAIRVTTANVDGTIAMWKVELLKHELSEAKATSLAEAAATFVDKLNNDMAASRASKALQAEIFRKAKCRSQTEMEEREVFVPSEDSIRDIIRNELRLQSASTANQPEGNRQRKVSLVDSKSGGKRNGKSRKGRPEQRQQQQQRQRSSSAKRSKSRTDRRQQQKQRQRSNSANGPKSRSSSKNARGKGSGHVR